MIPLPIHNIQQLEEKRLKINLHQKFFKRFKFHNRIYTNWNAVANLDKHKCRLIIFN